MSGVPESGSAGSAGFASVEALPEEAFAAAVASVCLPYLPRVEAALARRCPSEAWAVLCGRHPVGADDGDTVLSRQSVRQALRAAAATVDPGGLWRTCRSLGIGVTFRGHEDYPAVLVDDIEAPPVLFWKGSLAAISGRRVAIVGTRRATAAGRSIARQLGYELTGAGIAIVSGLARGIDGAAHHGALGRLRSAPNGGAVAGSPWSAEDSPGHPVGVVANGLDCAYPRDNAELWEHVAEHGVLISEAPPGAPPIAMLFPRRNRIIAAASEVLVVVESAAAGGSMLTVNEATKRGLTVMAVPGSPTNPVAAGTNRLLRDGSSIVVDSADVLAELSLNHGRQVDAEPSRRRPAPPAPHQRLWQACRGGAATIEQLVLATGAEVGEVATGLVELVADGWLTQVEGWYEVSGDR